MEEVEKDLKHIEIVEHGVFNLFIKTESKEVLNQVTSLINNCDYTSFPEFIEKSERYCGHGPNDERLKRCNKEFRHFLYVCSECFFKSLNQDDVVNHLKQSCERKQIIRQQIFGLERCPLCDHKTDCETCLRKHCDIEHTGLINITKSYNTKIAKNIFLNTYKCSICNYVTTSGNDFYTHSTIRHIFTVQFRESSNNETTSINESNSQLTKRHICNVCTLQFKESSQLRLHMRKIHDNGLLCEFCAYKTNCLSSLMKHKLRKHTPEELIEWHKCDQCSYKAKILGALKIHMTRHDTDKTRKFQCKNCSAQFQASHLLQRHMKLVHLSKFYLCEFCGYKTWESGKLKRHKTQKHTTADSIRWHRCAQCDYKGKTSGLLKSHIYHQHTSPDKIRWEQCKLCSYKAKMKVELRRHVNTKHAELKVFECDQCDFTSKTEKALNNHVFRKHNE